MNNAIVAVNLDHECDYRQEAIQAGMALSGNVSIQVQREICPTDLALELTGKEKTFVMERGKKLKSSHCFFRVDVQLYNEKNNLEPKTYIFPFSIPLPPSLPSSRKHEDSDGSFSIDYGLKLKMNGNEKFLNKRPIEVVSVSRKNESIRCLVQPKPIIPEALGIDGRGYIYLGAYVKDSIVVRGQELECSLSCRNESNVQIDRAVLTLEEEYYYTAASFGGHGSCKLSKRDDVKWLPAVRIGGSSRGEDSILDSETIARRMFKELKSKENLVSLKIPRASRESYSGVILKISHFLKFTLITKTEEDNYPCMRFPIQIEGEKPSINAERQRKRNGRISEHESIRFHCVQPDRDAILLGRIASEFDEKGVAVSSFSTIQPSMKLLQEEMAASVDHYDFLLEKMTDLDWAIFFASLRPGDYGTVIAMVGADFEQPRVAILLAENYGSDFTCAHGAAAVRNVSTVFRSSLAENLLGLCSDLAANNILMRKELTDFEQIIVALHALNEDEDVFDDSKQASKLYSSQNPESLNGVPRDVMIRTNSQSEDPDKPASDLSLETALRDEDDHRKKVASVVPRDMDVLIGRDFHEGTAELTAAIQMVVDEGEFSAFCPPVYRLIKRKFPKDQRYLICPFKSEPDACREASKIELIEYVGKLFEEMSKKKRSQGLEENVDKWHKPELDSAEGKWKETLQSRESEWELALTVHSFASTFTDDINSGPATMDVCFFKARHHGNVNLIRSVRRVVHENPRAKWSPPVYRAIKKSLVGKRFFIRNDDNTWREANHVERRESFQKYFEAEKKRIGEKLDVNESEHAKVESGESPKRVDGMGKREAEGLGSSNRSKQPSRREMMTRQRSERPKLPSRRDVMNRQGSERSKLPSRRDMMRGYATGESFSSPRSVRRSIGTKNYSDSKVGSLRSSGRMSMEEIPRNSETSHSSERGTRRPAKKKGDADVRPKRSSSVGRMKRMIFGEDVPSTGERLGRNEPTERRRSSSLGRLFSLDRFGEGSQHKRKSGSHHRRSRAMGEAMLDQPPPSQVDVEELIRDEDEGCRGSPEGSRHRRKSDSQHRRSHSSSFRIDKPRLPSSNDDEAGREEEADHLLYNDGSRHRRKSGSQQQNFRVSSFSPEEPAATGINGEELILGEDEEFHGEMALNDTDDAAHRGRDRTQDGISLKQKKSRSKSPFKRLTRKLSIRNIGKRNMRHPRDMDICYGSESHPGTMVLLEATVKTIHRAAGKPWSNQVYKSIRSNLRGRRFFVRDSSDAPWREATTEQQLELTKRLYIRKCRERRGN